MAGRRTWWWLGGAAAVAVAAGVAAARPRPPAAPRWETAEVERGDVIARVTASGTVSARRTVLVSSQVSGRVKEVLADFNTPVREGQVLARIDPRQFQAAVAKAEASAASARASVLKAQAQAAEQERQARRTRELFDRRLAAQAELDTAEAARDAARAELAVAEAAVAQARAALEQARYDLASTVIRAPVDGLVVSRDVEEGQTVAASLQAPTLFTLAEDLRSMQVRAHVSEGDIGRLSEGTRATFTVDAWPSERMEGTVRQVRNAAVTTQNVVTYDVVLDVDNPELKLKPGMTANVTFVVAERRDVLRVPTAALRFRPPDAAAEPAPAAAAARTVWRVEGAELRPVAVRAGVSDGAFTEIEADLAPGARVALRAAGAAAAGAQAAAPRRQAGPPRMF